MQHFPSPDIGRFGRRQRHARGHRVAVTIVSGAGEAPPEDHAVVVADIFGAKDVAPLGGCRCCTVRVELQRALRRLLTRRDQQPFNRVVMRTDEDVGAILRTFASERALGAAFHVDDHPPIAPRTVEGIRHFVWAEDASLDWNAFSRFMTTLVALRGADLLHARGLLNVAGCRGPVVVQFLQHLAHQPVELQAWPDDDRASRLAFTTRNVDERSVRDLFSAVRALG
jgi:G3E family GTPase